MIIGFPKFDWSINYDTKGVVVLANLSINFLSPIKFGPGAINIYDGPGIVFSSSGGIISYSEYPVANPSIRISGNSIIISNIPGLDRGRDYLLSFEDGSIGDGFDNYYTEILTFELDNTIPIDIPDGASISNLKVQNITKNVAADFYSISETDLYLDFGTNAYNLLLKVNGSKSDIYRISYKTVYSDGQYYNTIAEGVSAVINEVFLFKRFDINFSVPDYGESLAQDRPPYILAYEPSDGTSGVALKSNITVEFSENIARGNGSIRINIDSPTGKLFEIYDVDDNSRISISGNKLIINPLQDLNYNTHYFVVFDIGSIKDLNGNSFSGNSDYDFFSIASSNRAPSFSSSSQSVSTSEDTASAISVSATDADGDALTYSVSSSASNGTTSVSGGTVTYTPRANYNGTDSFVVTAADGKGGTATQTVNVTVASVNDAPTFSASSQSVSATAGAAKTITLAATDVDGDALTYTVTTPAKGSATISGSTLTYANVFGNRHR